MTKQASKDERKHMAKVAGLGCYLCRLLGYGWTPAVVHHVREGVGMAQRNSHYLTVPLCIAHHADSENGIHGERKAWKLAGVGEMDALADTIMLITTANG